MNFQMAGIVGAATFVLSFLTGLIGGVPFLDIVLRALFWGALGAGGSLGIETLLRSLVPDLFLPPGAAPEDSAPPRAVDITLDEEPIARGSFVEEVGDEPEPVVAALASKVNSPVPDGRTVNPLAVPVEVESEEMPEIGTFLDAFKPSSEEGESVETSSPEYGDYAPIEPSSGSSQEVTFDGEAQDPVILAKAVQTIMKRDA